MRRGQIQFEFIGKNPRSDFGGSLLKNSHAKGRRPFSPKKPMHIVMRSSLARGQFSMRHPKHIQRIKEIIKTHSHASGVRVYRFANSGNHLHLLVLTRSMHALRRFLRAVTGLIARYILKTEKTRPLPQGVAFWDQRPFSRIVTWGKEYAGVAAYLLQNTLEALGFVEYKPRPTRIPWKRTAPE